MTCVLCLVKGNQPHSTQSEMFVCVNQDLGHCWSSYEHPSRPSDPEGRASAETSQARLRHPQWVFLSLSPPQSPALLQMTSGCSYWLILKIVELMDLLRVCSCHFVMEYLGKTLVNDFQKQLEKHVYYSSFFIKYRSYWRNKMIARFKNITMRAFWLHQVLDE